MTSLRMFRLEEETGEFSTLRVTAPSRSLDRDSKLVKKMLTSSILLGKLKERRLEVDEEVSFKAGQPRT